MTAAESRAETAVARPLDFAVIGASKSGTTSLFHYLRSHPSIYLPPGKDLPFFAADPAFARGWEAAAAEHYAAALPDALWGTVTPRYMEDARVPERMRRLMPEIRLAALVRNPIDRAFSQYRQQVRLGKEKRSFPRAVADELDRAALARARSAPQELDAGRRYLATGEYGRILAGFLERFEPGRLAVLFTEELEGEPGATLDPLLVHLGLSPGFRPPNLDHRYHRGGTRERFPGLPSRLKRLRPARPLWRLLPVRRRRAAWTWLFTRANVVAEPAPEMPAPLRDELASFFREDVRMLEPIAGRPVPWPELTGRRGAEEHGR